MNQEKIINIISFIIVIIFVLLITSLIFALANINPLEGFRILIRGAVGRTESLSESLVRTVPILFAALGILVAFKGGLWNVGAEGQFYMGAVGATYAALFISVPQPLHIILVMIFAFVFAAFWGGLAGLLKIKFGANEILTTLMLNYVAIWFTHYLCFGPWRDVSRVIAATAWFPETARLSRLIEGYRVNTGLFFALAAAVVVYLMFKYTKLGQTIKVMGSNLDAARYSGVNLGKTILIIMFISGGIAGLAGAAEVSGVYYCLRNGNYPISPGYGYYAIGAALLGNLSVLGTVLSSILFGGIITGAAHLKTITGLHAHSVDFIVGLLILAVLARNIFVKKLTRLLLKKKPDIPNQPVSLPEIKD